MNSVAVDHPEVIYTFVVYAGYALAARFKAFCLNNGLTVSVELTRRGRRLVKKLEVSDV